MKKKLLIVATILVFSICLCTLSFANDAGTMLQDAANGVKNAVGGAENVLENTAGGAANTAKNATQGIENGMNNVGNSMSNTMTNITSNAKTNNDTGYTATRTSTATEPATFMGMTSTAWTWLIIGIAALAIVALVWYYGTQMRSSNYNDRD